jgi:cation:H+ antiporter
LLDFKSFPVSANIAILSISAGVVWLAGGRLAGYCKLISERTRAGQAIIGTVLLGGVVSLPEMTMGATASFRGNAPLAVNVLLGGIALAVLTLAITDAAVGGQPLSSDVVRPVVLLQGTLVVLLLVVAGGGIAVGDHPLFGAGIWTTAIAALYVLFLVLISRYQKSRSWIANTGGNPSVPTERRIATPLASHRPFGRILAFTAITAVAVALAGCIAAIAADALAEQTRLGASFFGFILGGIVTTLPEISSTIAAVRLKQYEMAYGDAFGTNLFSIMLLYVVDLVYSGGPILREVGQFSLIAILLGIAVTSICVSGLIARPKKRILRMGVDSALVIGISAVGLLLLYTLK